MSSLCLYLWDFSTYLLPAGNFKVCFRLWEFHKSSATWLHGRCWPSQVIKDEGHGIEGRVIACGACADDSRWSIANAIQLWRCICRSRDTMMRHYHCVRLEHQYCFSLQHGCTRWEFVSLQACICGSITPVTRATIKNWLITSFVTSKALLLMVHFWSSQF